MKKLDLFVLSKNSTIATALECFEANLNKIIFVENESGQIVGSLSDGDIRRGLLSGCSIDSTVASCLNKNFIFVSKDSSLAKILKQFDRNINVLPVIDENGLMVDVILKEDFSIVAAHPTYVVSRAPCRIAFSGGGSDLTYYFVEGEGAVLNATINLYCNVRLRKRFDRQIHVTSFDLNQDFIIKELKELASIPDEFQLIKTILDFVKPDFGFELQIKSDFPVGSGLGGSSALVVAVLEAFNKMRGNLWTKREIAEFAFKIERLDLGVMGGWQDQYAAAYGGINFMQFTLDNTRVVPVFLEPSNLSALESSLLLCDTGLQHESGHLHEVQKKSIEDNNLSGNLEEHVKIAHWMWSKLIDFDIGEFGKGLNQGWLLKRKLSPGVTNPGLDKIYNLAIASGASGGKLLGAGGGGHFLFICPPFRVLEVARAMTNKGFSCKPVFFDSDGAKSWLIRE